MFNIASFLGRIGGGLAQSNLFIVHITRIPNVLQDRLGGKTQEDLVFFCKTVELPSLTIQGIEHMKNAFGKKELRPNGIEYPSLPTIFMLDANHDILRFFHAWSQSVVNYDHTNTFGQVGNALPGEINYKTDYVGSIDVHFYSSTQTNGYYKYSFDNVYPSEVGTVSLSWENNNEIATLPVSFSYDILDVDGSLRGIDSESAQNRGTGLIRNSEFDMIARNVLTGGQRPMDIQEIINQKAANLK